MHTDSDQLSSCGSSLSLWRSDTSVVPAQEAAARTALAGSDIELLALLAGPRARTIVARHDDVFVDLAPLLGERISFTLSARIQP
jgi:hypothetical protein